MAKRKPQPTAAKKAARTTRRSERHQVAKTIEDLMRNNHILLMVYKEPGKVPNYRTHCALGGAGLKMEDVVDLCAILQLVMVNQTVQIAEHSVLPEVAKHGEQGTLAQFMALVQGRAEQISTEYAKTKAKQPDDLDALRKQEKQFDEDTDAKRKAVQDGEHPFLKVAGDDDVQEGDEGTPDLTREEEPPESLPFEKGPE